MDTDIYPMSHLPVKVINLYRMVSARELARVRDSSSSLVRIRPTDWASPV